MAAKNPYAHDPAIAEDIRLKRLSPRSLLHGRRFVRQMSARRRQSVQPNGCGRLTTPFSTS
jgi:hypothetical protein